MLLAEQTTWFGGDALELAYDLDERDLVRGPGQSIAAAVPACRLQEPRVAERPQDLREVIGRNVRALGQIMSQHRAARGFASQVD